MSIFSKGGFFDKLARGTGDVARKVASNPLTSFTPLAPVAGIINKLSPVKVPIPAPSTPLPIPAPSFGGGVIGGAIGGAIGDVVNRFLPAIPGLTPGTGVAKAGCGCNGSSGRDPCTRQRMSSQPAPLATFFGGCCPPGRTLRRKPMGRDICIRTPRMNPFNPSALARADRRITTFARRTAPILKDMGYTVSSHRHVKLGTKKRKRR